MVVRAPADHDEGLFDPDEVQVPESRPHYRLASLVRLAAAHLLGPQWAVDSNMNWYPPDEAGAMAPDVMVLPAGLLDQRVKSYRQDQLGGPAPAAVVEVASESDSYGSMLSKLARYQALGTVVYVATCEGAPTVYRLAPDDGEPRRWLGQACPELGGLVFQVEGDVLSVWLPGAMQATSSEALTAELDRRAAEAQRQAAEAQRQAAEAERRIAALEAQLRALGAEPADRLTG